MKNFGIVAALIPFGALLAIAFFFTVGWERPPINVQQVGYRGTGMEEPNNPREQASLTAMNQVPPEIYPLDSPADLANAPKASEIYENVQVLGDLPEPQFTRLMAAITEWVAPEEGCGYCHNLDNLADDSLYTKTVSRRMIQMTWDINSGWQDHVKETGVTCYTCHRGNPVPANIWFNEEPQRFASAGMLGWNDGQNRPSDLSASTSLPVTAFAAYLAGDAPIRVQSTAALPTTEGGATIQQTEQTYGLMMHMSDGLGVGCTYCHNTQAFGSWELSPPPRQTAWHGIRMVQDLNGTYMEPLTDTFPAERLGPTGDVPKANCATCHQGVFKPLYGASMLDQYPSLSGSP
jgi:photosynthetic reaction center cytochrome c subunit